MDSSTRTLEIGAAANGGHITLEGPFLEGGDFERALDVARAVEGVSDVEYTEGYSHLFELACEPEEVELCTT
jgi:osmotically-inducible protein OsmY